MFKYVRYIPITDENTTHVFNELNEKCKVNRFDVPCVSVEYENEADFSEIMEYQGDSIEAVEITKEEFSELVQDSDQVKRMYDVANEQYQNETKPISRKYSQEERDTWPSQVAEANAVKMGNTSATPYLTALANDGNITIEASAEMVLAKKEQNDIYASSCLARKWATLASLKKEVGL